MVDPKFPPNATLSAVLATVRTILESHRIGNAHQEARWLICDAAGLDPTALLTAPDMVLDAVQRDTISEWIGRRCAGEPVARMRGWQEFCGRPFLLSAATLEPRPDTETLINAALELIDARQGRGHPWRIVDVGTGTGCIALTLLAELPHATAVGTDISAHAVDTAERNAVALGLSKRISFGVADYLEGIEGPFDIVISNPPYIKRDEIAGLQVEVREHDPLVALDGGADGLEPYRIIASMAADVAAGRTQNGLLIFETACDDDRRVIAAVRDAARGAAWQMLKVWPDLNGCNRCVAFETLR